MPAQPTKPGLPGRTVPPQAQPCQISPAQSPPAEPSPTVAHHAKLSCARPGLPAGPLQTRPPSTNLSRPAGSNLTSPALTTTDRSPPHLPADTYPRLAVPDLACLTTPITYSTKRALTNHACRPLPYRTCYLPRHLSPGNTMPARPRLSRPHHPFHTCHTEPTPAAPRHPHPTRPADPDLAITHLAAPGQTRSHLSHP